jgi:membrane dipeptidase
MFLTLPQPLGQLPNLCLCPQASNHLQPPEEEPIPLDQLDGSCRTNYGYSEAPGLHRQPGALLALLAALFFSLHLL